MVLLGFAVGWALLAVLSMQLTDHPQHWAAAPAVFLTVAGLISLLGPDTAVGHTFRRVWPPLLLVLAVWSITLARRRTPAGGGHREPGCGAPLIGDSNDSVAPQARDEARASVSTARSVQSYIDELRAGVASVHQAATLVDFGSKPLIVLTALRGNPETWLAAQDKLATLSSNSRHRVVVNATHASLYLDRTHAAPATKAFRDVGAAVRSSRPLE